MTTGDSDRQSDTALPIIDISGLRGDGSVRRAVLAGLRKASLDTGFFYVVGHGVAAELIARIFAQAKAFFDRPMEEKLRIKAADSRCFHGYEPLRAQTLEPGTPPDVKEGYLMGLDLPLGHPAVTRDPGHYGPNRWPGGMTDFEPAMTAYFREVRRVAEEVLRALALTLELPADYFDEFSDTPVATLRLLHYPRPSRRSRRRARRAAAPIPTGAPSPSCSRTTRVGCRFDPPTAGGSMPNQSPEASSSTSAT